MTTCASCGKELPGEFPFCPFCGAELAAAPAAPAHEERKVVSVLFCDLVGFTSRAEQLDPEDVRALLGPYYGRLRAELERFGGTVEKFIGDAVMALFGAPVAHEDDPERAVRAALAIRDWIAEQDAALQVRIAITTGEALVALGARVPEGEGMASGDVVNTAARLQSAAPVNGILVDETTCRATQQVISYEPAEAVQAKGKSEPIKVWRALEARSRFGVDLIVHARAPLVGREPELDALRDALARATSQHSVQLVTLVGVPGIGKSRLLFELMQSIESRSELVFWRQGRSLPYGDGVTLWALAEMVKAQAGILETDSGEAAQAKLSATVRDLIADTVEAQWVESHLLPLAGLGVEVELGGDRRGEAFAAWRRFFEALAERRPLVLVFEDLQWADDELLDFVDHLVDWASGVPLLVVCTARPELLERRPGWGGGKRDAVTVSLARLTDNETAALFANLFERSVLPAETQQRLLARAGGNPLYAEQYVRMLAERGSDQELPLPENVQGIIAARLDALAAEEKALLQEAAVIGKLFWVAAVAHGDRRRAEERLHALERKEFVQRARRSSIAGETEFTFAHVLVRDVAYAQIPRAERAEKHRRAAQWIGSLGRPEDHAEMLAHHWLSALELAQAVGRPDSALEESARSALAEAGDRALALHAQTAAAEYYARALELWPARDPERAQLQFRHAQALHRAGEERAVELLDEARAALLEAGARETAAEADALLAEAWWLRGSQENVFVHIERARQLVAEEPVSTAKARVLAWTARYLTLAGGRQEAITVAREALAAAEQLGLEELRAHALNTIGIARVYTGDRSGVRDIERAIEIARAVNSPEASRATNNLAAVTSGLGDVRRALELYAEAARLNERFGNRQLIRFGDGIAVWGDFMTGDWDRALGRAEAFIQECEAGSPHYQESGVRHIRAIVLASRGQKDEALAEMGRAVALARSAGDPQALYPVLAGEVKMHVVLGDLARARSLATEVMAAESFGAGVTGVVAQLVCHAEELGIQDRLREHLEEGHDTLWAEAATAVLDGDHRRGAELYEQVGAGPPEADARLLAARSLIRAGRRQEGELELQRALSFWRAAGASAFLRRGEALLAASA